jgi:hypothetical protein
MIAIMIAAFRLGIVPAARVVEKPTLAERAKYPFGCCDYR